MNRTAEFHSCVQLHRRAKPQSINHEKQRHGPSTFTSHASRISKQIGETTRKLERLAQLAKRKSLFDDRPVEISELTYVIRQDLAALNTSISELQTFVKGQRRKGGKEEGEHSENVVVLLQGKLAEVSMGFKDVLEVRTKNIQASKSRTEQFMASTSSAAAQERSYRSDSPLYQTTTNPPDEKDKGQDFLTLDIDGNQQQQLLLQEQQDTYIDQRGAAIETIESTIHELGSIFSQLAGMVAEQRETVQRIDANTEDVVTNVGGAQRELFKYYARVSSNRWLMIKMFGVIIVGQTDFRFINTQIFFLLWVLVGA